MAFDVPRPLSARDGALLVFRREVAAILRDRQALAVSVFFALGFPLFITLQVDPRGRSSMTLLLGLLSQVSIFPYLGFVQGALSAFLGERENGTLGPLLATPLSNTSIFVGKLLAGYLPAVAFAAVGFATGLGSAARRSPTLMSQLPLSLFPKMFLLSMLAGLAMMVFGIALGLKAKTVRGAQGLSGILIGPIMGLFFFLGTQILERGNVVFVIAIGFVAIVALTIRGLARRWRREEALTSS